jgi:uncharacterized protein YehS (DUF1456 family)
MTNNEVLQHVRYIFSLDSDKIASIFQLAQCKISSENIADFLRKNGEVNFKRLDDNLLASFLDGLIIERRGPKDGAESNLNQQINNNVVFNKLKIALSLKADDIIQVLRSGELELSKHELSAFFRKADHKHYRECTDETLLKFLNGLHLAHRDTITEIKE